MSDRRSFLKVLVGLPVVGVLPVPEPVLVMHRYGLKKFDHSLYSRIRVTCVKPSGSVGLVGAAGGLNPENIRANLDLMRERGYIRDGFWIDVESGVRTDDRWDWDKARAFIENTEDAQSIMEVVPRSASI
jgi:hypothetical protein